MKWLSKINGKQLRGAINDGRSFKVLVILERLLNRISNSPKMFKLDEYDLEEFTDLLYRAEGDIQLGEEGLLAYVKQEYWIGSMSEYVDGQLSEFYDLCDKNRIWVEL